LELSGRALQRSFNAAGRHRHQFIEVLELALSNFVFAVTLWRHSCKALELIVEVADVVVAHAHADLRDGEVRRDQQGLCLADAPPDYIQAMCKALKCFEFTIESVEAAYKLSQNQSAENRSGVVNGLQAQGSAAAEKMAEKVQRFAPDS
jgi:hypothetical protein